MKLSGFALLACTSSALAFAPPAFQRQATSLHMAGVLTKTTGKSSLDPAVIAKYDALAYPKDLVLAEYVWVDADGNTRSKTRTLPATKVCHVWTKEEISRQILQIGTDKISCRKTTFL